MKAIVLSPKAIVRLMDFSIEPEWFKHCVLPSEATDLKRVIVDDIVYLLDRELADDNVSLVVIDQSREQPILDETEASVAALDRLISVAISLFHRTVSISTKWRPFKQGSAGSIYAASRTLGAGDRLVYDTRPNGELGLFVYARTHGSVAFEDVTRNDAVYSQARAGLAEAILTPVLEQEERSSRAGIVLSKLPIYPFLPDVNVDEWYSSRLTDEQRAFVDKPHDGPVRLRGAAGTGKTLALVLKMLRDWRSSGISSSPPKYLFLTHSTASVEQVNMIATSLDFSWMSGQAGAPQVRTLYDVAHEFLRFDLDHLSPLSLDGREGRKIQLELIGLVLEKMASSSILRAQFSSISSHLSEGWKNLGEEAGRRLIADVANEFASVLDAEGIRSGEEAAERYVLGSGRRPAWLMALPEAIDRRFVLEVHRRYRDELGAMNTLSIDQMIADYNSFLDTNRWDRIRERDGFDALFVDELHLFTAMERQTLHKVIRRKFEEGGKPKRPPIFMAYDLKQSPKDSFTQYDAADNNLFGSSTGLQNSELVRLSKVFRYTPEIAAFLEDMDASFPAIDIPGEWEAYVGQAQRENGSTPTLTVYPKDVDLFRAVFEKASKAANRAEGGGRRVAVLCLSEEMFDVYENAGSGQFKNRFVTIRGRDNLSELRHSGKRFVFSMPEYVAGLQFETVLLIHADAKEAPSDATLGGRRRFVSNVYLGASRSESNLEIVCSLARGGAANIFELALARGNLIQMSP